MRALLLLIVLAVMASGCGYKGALYLPKDKPPRAQKPAAPPAAPTPEKKADE